MSGFYADLDILLLAKPRKNESKLTAYARACRYRGGVEELYRVATSDGDRFYEKHAKVTARPSPHYRNGTREPPIVPSREHVERVRGKIVQRFVVEEMAHRVIDAAEAATGHRLIAHEPLSPCRPMRPQDPPHLWTGLWAAFTAPANLQNSSAQPSVWPTMGIEPHGR
jgi:hypothetical protein